MDFCYSFESLNQNPDPFINVSKSNCIQLFSNAKPHQNDFWDYLSFVFVSLFTSITLISSILFVVLKKKNIIQSQFKDSYLIITTLASFFHVSSIFLTYGFFWPYLNNAIVVHTCSLWNFWFQWFLGFGLWISILCIRIFSIAQTTIPKLISHNNKIVVLQRLGLFLTSLGIIVVIGIIAEIFHSFYIDDDHKCSTKMWIKILITIWIVIMVISLVIMSVYIKRESLIDDDSYMLNMELRIFKVTWSILVICVVLNFLGITIYGFFRFLFITAVMIMYLWSSLVIYINHLLLYFFEKLQCINIVLDFFNVHPNSKYQLLNDTSDILNKDTEFTKQYFRQNFSSDEENNNNYNLDVNDDFSNPLMVKIQNPFIDSSQIITSSSLSSNNLASSSHISADNVSNINIDDFADKKKMIQIIKTNNDCLKNFCEKINIICQKEFDSTSKHKNYDFQVFDDSKQQFTDVPCILKSLIDFFIEYHEHSQTFILKQITYDDYIRKIAILLNRYIQKDLLTLTSNNMGILSNNQLSDQTTKCPLENMNKLTMIHTIVFLIKSYNLNTKEQTTYPELLITALLEFHEYLLNKIVDDHFDLWNSADGLDDLKKIQEEKNKVVKSLNNDSETYF